MSEPTGFNKIAGALAKAQGEFPAVEKTKTVRVRTKTGGMYEFSYAPLDTILAAVRPALTKNGLSITQVFADDTMMTVLIHESGQFLESRMKLPQRDVPQEFGSIISYYRRYAIQALLGIVAEEDDDGNIAAGNTVEKTVPSTQTTSSRVVYQQKLTEAQRKLLFATAKRRKISDELLKAILQEKFNLDTTKDLTTAQLDLLLKEWEPKKIKAEDVLAGAVKGGK